MDQDISPINSVKKPEQSQNEPTKSSITCSNVPESLFDTSAAKKHFSKFGRVNKIRLLPKKRMCVVEYEHPNSVQRAVLNAGAYDGFMFEVTRTKWRARRKSKKEDDPDWVPDSDVEEELSAMGGIATYRVPRQKPMELDTPKSIPTKKIPRPVKQVVVRKKVVPVIPKPKPPQPQVASTEAPAIVSTQTTLSTAEAAAELHQLRSKISLTPDEKWRTLDARDRILRSWGGAGSRVKVGGATIGTCPDMCPEKELLHRQAEHQVMTLETIVDSDGLLEPWRAVKQYSRSSADQEIPMCYELRPAPVLMRTCAYLLHEIADTTRQVSLADWFHFMWDRLRSIRKDITQQALCCAESIQLVEMCARFHAHCAARLADLEHTQFDQKLNTDNLTKCLQTLKHMYSDVPPHDKPNEPEFRAYIALLNLGDANFWWEIKQLPKEIQKSEPIIFAVKIFTALDNNNYVKFFRLIREEATYLQACILLRYFNDVRARALARIVKAFAPRGGSKYPAYELMNSLAFESTEKMKSFVNHYGLHFSKTDSELTVILDRNQFIEDSDPYPLSRSFNLIETKRKNTVAEIISGGNIPKYDYNKNSLHTSFSDDGKLKESSLVAQDLGYNTRNDSNKDVQSLLMELQRLTNGGKALPYQNTSDNKKASIVKDITLKPSNTVIPSITNGEKTFSFQRALPIELPESIKNSPEALPNDAKKLFTFSPPDTQPNSLFTRKENLFTSDLSCKKTIFGNENSTNVFKSATPKSVFASALKDTEHKSAGGLFATQSNTNIFTKKDDSTGVFATSQQSKNIFAKPPEKQTSNIFTKPPTQGQETQSLNVFRSFTKTPQMNIVSNESNAKVSVNGDSELISPGTLFKQANDPSSLQPKPYSFFQSKNKPSVASNIFQSIKTSQESIYDFNDDSKIRTEDEQEQTKLQDAIKEQERILLEEKKKKELELKKIEMKQKEEAKIKQEQLKKLEEARKREEERKQVELKKKLEEERQAELLRKAKEKEKQFKERVEKESNELLEEFVNEVGNETVGTLIKEEMDSLRNLLDYSRKITDEILMELLEETCNAELKAEIFWTNKVMKKWFNVWRKQILRNSKRRRLLESTPVWLPQNNPIEEAQFLRRPSEKAELTLMHAIHRGYIFNEKPKEIPLPEPYNLMEIIRSPLLKRMKQINYPYDKCFFWKTTIVSPGSSKWFCKRVNIESWLLHAFKSKNIDSTENLIHLEKESWNNLMDFATSVSLINLDKPIINEEAMDGTNGVIFFLSHEDCNFDNIEKVLRDKLTYHIVPIAIVTTPIANAVIENHLQTKLSQYVGDKVISDFKFFIVDPTNLGDSLKATSKSALKWLAKRCPKPPSLELDTLKNICHRYLGYEIWHRLKSDNDSRVQDIMKDIEKLIEYYNTAVDKLTEVITNEDLFNYPSFPNEFKNYLNYAVLAPKPYEFIPSCLRNSGHANLIKNVMQNLKLRIPSCPIAPNSISHLRYQVHKYCQQIGWFKNPEQVVCKVVDLLPSQFSESNTSSDSFINFFKNFNLIDMMNIIVYEKISILKNFSQQFAFYHKDAMEDYRNGAWLYDTRVLASVKHKADETLDDLDYLIDAKRRKLNESNEQLTLEDKDCTMVHSTIKSVDRKISKCNTYKKAITELESKLKEEKKKSEELEQMLYMALHNV